MSNKRLSQFVHPLVRSTVHLTSGDAEQVVLHEFGGDGPPLLLGHGNGLNAGMWLPALPKLKTRFRCFGVDLRGHGACQVVDTNYSVERERLGEDLMACVDSIGEPVAYAGHSLGGAAGIYGSLARPDLFIGMWLFEPVVIADWVDRSSPPTALVEMTLNRRSRFDSTEDAIERLMAKPPFGLCDPEAVRGYVEFGTRRTLDGGAGVELTCKPRDEARVFGTGQPMDFGRLAVIKTPTAIVTGAEVADLHSIPAQMAAPLAQALPNGCLERHPALGHFGPMEAPIAMAESIISHVVSSMAG